VKLFFADAIQHFEIAYEQCWKSIQRWLQENATQADEAEKPRTRRELFRQASRAGLIPDPLPWFEYGNARNLTSHIYDEDQALQVLETAGRFLCDARTLLEVFEHEK